MRRLLAVVAVMAVATLGIAPASAAPAKAKYAAGCQTATRLYKIYSGGTADFEHIMDIHDTATVCWGTNGRMNGHSYAMAVTDTSWGSAYGFSTDTLSNGLVGQFAEGNDSYQYMYQEDKESKNCVAEYVPICGHHADFNQAVMLGGPLALGPTTFFFAPQCSGTWACEGKHLIFVQS